MTRRLASIGAIMRKDFLTLWVMTLLAVALPLAQPWGKQIARMLSGVPLELIAAIVSLLLIFIVVQNDAAASMRHDWLTRPIRRADMVIAKALFLAGAVVAPWIIGRVGFVVIVMHDPLAEGLLAGVGLLAYGALLLPFLALASVTANKVEAVVTLICIPIATILYFLVADRFPVGTAIIGPGQSWGAQWLFVGLAAAISGLVLWLQYGRRRTLAARGVVVGGAAVIAAFTLLPEGPAGAAGSKGAPSVAMGQPEVCIVDEPLGTAGRKGLEFGFRRGLVWSGAKERAAGADPAAVVIKSRISGVPDGWTVAVDRLDVRYGEGASAVSPWGSSALPSGITTPGPVGTVAFDTLASSWLMSRSQAVVAKSGQLHMDAQLTLMKPVRTYSLEVNAPRRFIHGLGYCGAESAGRGTQLDCLNIWPIPAQITGRLASQPDPCLINCGVDDVVYAPVWAQPPTARRFRHLLKPANPNDKVLITVYEPAGRISRSVAAAGSSVACPEFPSQAAA